MALIVDVFDDELGSLERLVMCDSLAKKIVFLLVHNIPLFLQNILSDEA